MFEELREAILTRSQFVMKRNDETIGCLVFTFYEGETKHVGNTMHLSDGTTIEWVRNVEQGAWTLWLSRSLLETAFMFDDCEVR